MFLQVNVNKFSWIFVYQNYIFKHKLQIKCNLDFCIREIHYFQIISVNINNFAHTRANQSLFVTVKRLVPLSNDFIHDQEYAIYLSALLWISLHRSLDRCREFSYKIRPLSETMRHLSNTTYETSPYVFHLRIPRQSREAGWPYQLGTQQTIFLPMHGTSPGHFTFSWFLVVRLRPFPLPPRVLHSSTDLSCIQQALPSSSLFSLSLL